MHLKTIEICGYKSFALKTRVDLEPGITGVIGPNGCGKSNVMEAVRWCLGEMSWKSLRADSMTDVIFAGTAKRAPLSMSEVTLTFDNAASLLPVQYSEVVISRRLFRSGESQYFLNKTQCRLRDIREMFLDTGLGGDGYAIIDQGGVDQMIRAKPEERRAFFEEAAGVARYNAKREEALRKLDRVDADLGRLQDAVALIEEQVKKLDSDARKAKLYAKYKEELALQEAAHILQQADELGRELARMQEAVGPVEELLGERRSQIAAEGAGLAALNLEKTGEQNRFIEANQKVAEAKTEIGRLEERLRGAADAVAAMDARAEACRAEAAAGARRAEQIAPEIAAASASVEQARTELEQARAEAESARADLAAEEGRVRDAQGAKDAKAREAQAQAEETRELGRRAAQAEADLARAEVRAHAARRSLERDQEGAAQARAALEALTAESAEAESALARASAESAAADSAIEDLRRRQAAQGEEAVRLHADLARDKARAEALEVQGGQNPYWIGAQTVLSAGIPGVLGTVRSLLRVEDSVKPALEDLLGERLYAVVVEDSAAARAGVELLQGSASGRARFLVLSSLPEPSGRPYPPGARPVLARLRYDPAHDRIVRHLLDEAYELGGAIYGDHWVFGGSAPKGGAQPALADLGELKERAAALESRGKTLGEERAALEASLSEAAAAARRAAEALALASGRRQAMDSRAEQLRQALSNQERNVEISAQELAQAETDAAAARASGEESRARRAEAESRAAAAREQEARVAEEAVKARERFAERRAAFQGVDERRRSVEERLAAHESSRKRLDDEKAALDAAAARLESEQGDLSRRRAETLESQERMRGELASGGEVLARRENEALAVHDRLQELQKSIDARSEALKKLQAEHDQAQADLHQHEVQATALKSRQDLLKNRLWDEWQLGFDEARAKYAGVVPDVEKIETLKRRVASLGNVNMAAPEEYEALAEKQKGLQGQIQDLLQAKEDLKAAIAKINSSTRENFRQTFTEVREHFRRLYGVLFEGGEADLVMTDPENMLETGVEIVAQPPGKKLQSITLLSGGEKTLTAVALLFAFFMVRPSPFCMLDEADAALDDANIERFVALLREFQNKTQFLIVSHNKRTMEAADVIYGVTMEEKGVSMLVSVDFRGKSAPAAEAAKAGTLQQGPFEPAS